MKLIYHPKRGKSRATDVIFTPNCSGQGGNDFILLQTDTGAAYILEFNTPEEVTELLRQAAFVRMNKEEPK